jgi:membrane fusion protein (multidrug efflux system)
MIEENEILNNENSKEDSAINKPKLKKRIFAIGTIGIIVLSVGLFSFYKSFYYVSTEDAFVESHIVRIGPKISGNIIKVCINDNQSVKKGDLLLEIDPRDYQVKYEQAVAKLQASIEKQKAAAINVGLTSITSKALAEQAGSAVGASEASAQIAEKQISLSKANLAQVNQDIISVKAEYSLATSEFERYQTLYKKGVVSKQDLDKAKTNYATVNSRLNSALQRELGATASLQSAYANKDFAIKNLNQSVSKLKGADVVPQMVSISNTQKSGASAEIKQLQAAAKQAELELSYTKIYAPQSGYITSKSAEEGGFVQVGQPVLSIVSEKKWVIANFKETQLTNIKPGQKVFMKVDAYPGKEFVGHVDSIQLSTGSKTSLFPPENAVGSFVKVVQRIPVKIEFDETPSGVYVIAPGMSVVPEVKIR